MNILSPIVPVILMAVTGASHGFAKETSASPESASILEELIHQTTVTIGKADTAEQKAEKEWYNCRLRTLQRFEAIWCLDKRLSYEAARKLLDAEMHLADEPAAKLRVQAKRLRLEAEDPTLQKATSDQQPGGQKDPKAEIAKLREEIAKVRLELESALKEIKSLKDAIGQGAAPKDQGALYRGKPARVWLDQLKDGDPKFRAEAVEALGSLAEKNKELIPALVTALKDKNYFVGTEASKALASLGPDVVPVLLGVLKDNTSPKAVEGAADAIRRIGPQAKAAVPLLTQALKMDDWGVRRSCVIALGQIGPDAKPAIPAIVEVLGGLLKTVENDAKQGKSAKRGLFGIQGLPLAVVDALVKIDPEARNILPKGILTIGLSSRGPEDERPTLMEQLEQFQQAHAALKKKYHKAK